MGCAVGLLNNYSLRPAKSLHPTRKTSPPPQPSPQGGGSRRINRACGATHLVRPYPLQRLADQTIVDPLPAKGNSFLPFPAPSPLRGGLGRGCDRTSYILAQRLHDRPNPARYAGRMDEKPDQSPLPWWLSRQRREFVIGFAPAGTGYNVGIPARGFVSRPKNQGAKP